MEQRALRTPVSAPPSGTCEVVGRGHGQRTREAMERVPSFLHGDELLRQLPTYILRHPEATLRLAPMPMLKVKASVKFDFLPMHV
jgi:hypothetical protein